MSDASLPGLVMDFGPILRRELIVASRRGVIGLRAGSTCLVLLVMGLVVVGWDAAGRERSSLGGMAALARAVFGGVVGLQALLTLMMVTDEVSRILVGERQRKTLDGLLASSLSSAGIVVGVVLAGLMRWASCLAAGLPVLVLMGPWLGVDASLVLLAQAGVGATGFALAALGVAVSAGARSNRGALMGTLVPAMVWIFFPFLIVLSPPRFWPAGLGWVKPLARGLLDSSPMGVGANLAGLVGGASLSWVLVRMIACELAGGALLLVWTILRLRPVSRALADAGSRPHARRRRRAWGFWRASRRRPACGDDPMLWKELHVAREQGLRDSPGVVLVPIQAGLSLMTLYFARAAFRELFARGYGAAADSSSLPSSAVEWAVVLGRGLRPAPGGARPLFNLALREATMVFSVFSALLLMETAARSIVDERRQDTWPWLRLTMLSGGEVVRAKVIGAIWRVRSVLALMVALWLVGLAAGAVHPLGVLAALAVLSVSTGLTAVMATALSLWTRDASDDGRVSPLIVLLVVVLIFSGLLPRALPAEVSSVLLGAASAPLLLWLALVSWGDVAIGMRSGAFPELELLGIDTGEGVARAVATCLIGLGIQAAAAVLLYRAAVRSVDATVRRPARPL
jgi:hypothetical protein